MERNGDVASFAWVQRKILEGLTREGGNPDHLAALADKVRAISELLESFKAKRKEMGDSGRYTKLGLEEAAAAEAAKVANEIKRLMDDTHLKNNLQQKKRTLQASRASEPTERLLEAINGLREDLRVQSAQWAIQGLGIQAGDVLRYEMLYREALERGDAILQRAIEEWPIRSPISDALRQQGQHQREEAKNPLVAKEVRELEALHEQFQHITRDALAELPLAKPDPIEVMARGESVTGEGS